MDTNDLQVRLVKCEDKLEYLTNHIEAKINSIHSDMKTFGISIELENYLLGYLHALQMIQSELETRG